MQLDMRVLVLILEDPQNSASLSLKTSSVSLVSYICVPMHRVDTPGKPLGQKKKKRKTLLVGPKDGSFKVQRE